MAVTTVIPTIGRDTLWTRAVPSVTCQKADWRCIIVGDGVDIAPFDDPRITVLRIERPEYPTDAYERWRVLGVEAARFGIEHVETDWWSYLADDDEYDPAHHETLLDGIEDVDVAFGRSVYYSEDRTWPVWTAPPVPPGPRDVCQGAYIIRTDLHHLPSTALVEAGGWDATWWATLTAREGIRFRLHPVLVFHYYPDKGGFGRAWQRPSS